MFLKLSQEISDFWYFLLYVSLTQSLSLAGFEHLLLWLIQGLLYREVIFLIFRSVIFTHIFFVVTTVFFLSTSKINCFVQEVFIVSFCYASKQSQYRYSLQFLYYLAFHNCTLFTYVFVSTWVFKFQILSL